VSCALAKTRLDSTAVLTQNAGNVMPTRDGGDGLTDLPPGGDLMVSKRLFWGLFKYVLAGLLLTYV